MPSPPPAAHAIAVLLFAAIGFSACQVGSSPPPPPGAPSGAAVVGGRYGHSVDLDHRLLLVAPPSGRPSVTVTEDQARVMFEATDAVAGMHEFAILGLGVVTLSPSAEAPSTTTTSPFGAAPTTAPPPSSTSPASTSPSSTTASSSTTPAAATSGLPTYHQRLAWVGIAWGAPPTCAGASASVTAMATTTYVAVIIDARSPRRVLSYRSGGMSCAGTAVPPLVAEPNELLSVAWQPVGPGSTAVQIEVPPCGKYFGWTQVPTAGSAADQVVVTIPFDPTCGAVANQSQEVDQVVPLGPDQVLVPHAPVGPVQAFQGPPVG